MQSLIIDFDGKAGIQVKQFFKERATAISLCTPQHRWWWWFSTKAGTKGLRGRKPAKEKDAVGLVVPDEEQERVIAVETLMRQC